MQQDFNQHTPEPAPKKLSVITYILVGLLAITVLVIGVMYSTSENFFNLEKVTVDTESMCPENAALLQVCTYQIYQDENPDVEIPSELASQIDAYVTRASTDEGFSCPTTRKQLGACYADLQIEAIGKTIEYTSARQAAVVTKEEHIPTLDEFKAAENRWFERFSSDAIPTNSYKAYYFDSTKPDTILKTETVPKVAISYAWNDGDGFTVRSEDFGGYWIGNIVISEPGTYLISTAESWSDSRVIIDGHEIPINGEVKIAMEPGMYQVEVEYLNNWHTTNFAMNIEKETKAYSSKGVREKIEALSDAFDVWYVGTYESKNTNRTVAVNLQKKSSLPIILLLSSYSQVNWEIKNNSNTDIAYIVYGSYEPGTSVTAAIDSNKLLKVDRGVLPTEYTVKASCYDTRGAVFHCENIDGLTKIDDYVQIITGKKIDGFSGAYSVGSIAAPEQIITESVRAEIIKSYEDIRKERSDYEESQKIENVF